MSKIFSRSLARKRVMSNDGMIIGQIKNLMVDLDTGEVIDLLVKPEASFDTSGYRMDGDQMLIPFEAVKDARDYIVVDRYRSKK
ncbi:MAG: PRC-barrel domain-containing protein [Methanofollis liminatans]|jgi:sporulation protein YlmC with PRC-barrel domain|uniref:PRC-barrel domain-containing protein n=2 Tax=Methanofollis TaxID=81416 RepID=A0A7K4HQN7_9EURY|nr:MULTISPECIES: PRC-barrel domain-containing protein [Methanofollis]EJG07816.1 PRC-barrel domain protein [Methanofollis liminatans DSM 4140]MDD3110803.1 PRC-barrel domain-containing protein [Methanofollis liminatans]NVO67594.1 PRC-barrel domain-containing protein [Methanofollis tationis]